MSAISRLSTIVSHLSPSHPRSKCPVSNPFSSILFDVIVVGVGSMGSSSLYYLAKSGKRVLGIDRYPIANELNSHHGDSRIIRLAYFEHPSYVPMVMRSFDLWRDLERESGEALLTVTGGIDMGPKGSNGVEGARRSCEVNGIPYELINAEEVHRRFPAFSLPSNYVAVYQKDAAILNPQLCVGTYVRIARERYGARVIEGDGVDYVEFSSLSNGDPIVIVHTESGKVYRGRQCVLSNGPQLGTTLRKSFADHERGDGDGTVHSGAVNGGRAEEQKERLRATKTTREIVPLPSLSHGMFPEYAMRQTSRVGTGPSNSPTSLLPLIGHSIHPERNVVCWYIPHQSKQSSSSSPSIYSPSRFPIWLLDDEGDKFFYGFPEFGGKPGIKIGLYRHEREILTDYQLKNEEARPLCTLKDAELCGTFMSRILGNALLPVSDASVHTMKACIFTNSPDGHFIFDRFHNDRLLVLSCCSGHGFKFSSCIGEIVRDVCVKGKSERFDVEWLSSKRLCVHNDDYEGMKTDGKLFEAAQSYKAKQS